MIGRVVSLVIGLCLLGSAAALAEEATIARDPVFACQNPFTYERLMQFVGDGDAAAAKRLLALATHAGDCTRFRDGERVFVDGRSEPWVRIRRPGVIVGYWTSSDEIWAR